MCININTCNAFKEKLSQLIKIEWIISEEAINININPLPNHIMGNGSILEINGLKILKVSIVMAHKMSIKNGYEKDSYEDKTTNRVLRGITMKKAI